MKNNRYEEKKPNVSIVKNTYCITIENAAKKTAGRDGKHQENPGVYYCSWENE